VSPREKHVPDDAQRTSVCLTAAERAAIAWLREVRRNGPTENRRRTTINDILIDALWYFLDKTENRTKEQIEASLPPKPLARNKGNITQMPKGGKKR
jgi:hypothetical protein